MQVKRNLIARSIASVLANTGSCLGTAFRRTRRGNTLLCGARLLGGCARKCFARLCFGQGLGGTCRCFVTLPLVGLFGFLGFFGLLLFLLRLRGAALRTFPLRALRFRCECRLLGLAFRPALRTASLRSTANQQEENGKQDRSPRISFSLIVRSDSALRSPRHSRRPRPR